MTVPLRDNRGDPRAQLVRRRRHERRDVAVIRVPSLRINTFGRRQRRRPGNSLPEILDPVAEEWLVDTALSLRYQSGCGLDLADCCLGLNELVPDTDGAGLEAAQVVAV
ncbi:hypothetical protein KEM55_004892 [Ascosphaera atra]|nr:hypothetical protein KEM55_004892 [Ascosphaera atra]